MWYNQEVEGVGTDLRVCNLSYLQTDWYIDQMKRPYYESEALPIEWEYKDYMANVNEIVRVNPRMDTPLSVDKAFAFVRSDNPRAKMDGSSYIPSKSLYFDGPNGEQIPLSSKSYYTRSEMMIMEMLEHNDWKRPYYFAVSCGDSYYLGLKPYFELTGMAYRVTPTRSKDGQPRVNTEEMYDNMMHKFKFGNMDYPGVYIDENLHRMCHTHRMMFLELAEALVNERQNDKAREVINYSLKVLPAYNLPFASTDYTSCGYAQLLYRLGTPEDVEMANTIIRALADNCVEYLEWGDSLDKELRKAAGSTLGHQSAIFGYALQLSERNRQHDLLDEYYPLYSQYVK